MRANLISIEPIMESKELIAKREAASKIVPEDKIYITQVDTLYHCTPYGHYSNLGWTPHIDEEFETLQFCEKYKIKPEYKQLVYFYFTMLQETWDMLVLVQKDVWKVTKIPYQAGEEITTPINQLYDQLVSVSKLSAWSKFTKTCRKSSQVLTGEQSHCQVCFLRKPTSSIFPQRIITWSTLLEQTPSTNCCLRVQLNLLAIEAQTAVMCRKLFSRARGRQRYRQYQSNCLSRAAKVFGSKFEYFFTDISASFFIKRKRG